MSYQYQNFQKTFEQIQSQYNSPTEFVADYLSKNPQDTDFVKKLRQKGADYNTIAQVLVYKNSQPSLWQRAKSGAYTGYLETLKNLDALSRMLGIENPEQYQQRTQQISQEEQKYSVPEISLGDIKNASDLAKWLASSAGQLAEFGGELLAGEGATKLAELLGKGAVKLIGKEAAKKAAAEQFAKEATELTTKSAGEFNKSKAVKEFAKSVASKQPVLMPSQIGGAYREGEFQHPLTSILGGAASSLLYTASPVELLNDLTTKAATAEIDKSLLNLLSPKTQQVISSAEKTFPIATDTTLNTLKGAVEQSLLLGSANLAEQLGGKQEVNPQELEQSALLGALFGTAGGAIGGVAKGLKVKPKLKLADKYTDLIDRIDKRISKEKPSNLDIQVLSKNIKDLTSLDLSQLRPEDAQALKPKINNVVNKLSDALTTKQKSVLADRIKKAKNWEATLNKLKETANKINEIANEQTLVASKLEQNREENRFKPVKVENNKIERPIEISNTEKQIYSKIPLGEKPEKLKNYNENIHRKVIEQNFKDGYILTTKGNKPKWEDTINYYKSVGISSKDILDKFKDKIPPKYFDKDLAQEYVFGNIKPDGNNFHSIIQRAATVYKENPEIAKPIISKLKTEFKSIVNNKVKDLRDKFKDVPDEKIKSVIDNFKEIKISRNDTPKDLLNKIAKYTYLSQEADRLGIKDKSKINKTISDLTNTYFKKTMQALPQQKMKSISHTKFKSKVPSVRQELKIPLKEEKQPVSKIKQEAQKIKKKKAIKQPIAKKSIKQAPKVLKAPSKYFISIIKGDGTSELKPVTKRVYPFIHHDINLFAHKEGSKWSVTQTDTGLEVATGSTRKEAIEKAKSIFDDYVKYHSKKDLKQLIEDRKKELNIEPYKEKEIPYKKDLQALGYSESQIKRIKPEAAKEIIEKKLSPKEVSIKRDGSLKIIKKKIIEKKPKEVKSVTELSDKDKEKLADQLDKQIKDYDIIFSEGDIFASNPKEIFRSFYVTFPKDEGEINLKSFDDYLKTAGIPRSSLTKNLKNDFEKLYNLRKEQKSGKNFDISHLKEVVNTIYEIEKNFNLNNEQITRLSYGKEYIDNVKVIDKELEKVFNITKDKLLQNIFGEQLLKRIKVKIVNNPKELSLKDFGGRDKIIAAFKEGYDIDLSKKSDKELLTLLTNTKGFTLFNPKDYSTLIVVVKHQNDPYGWAFFHELFHTIERYKLIPREDIAKLKEWVSKDKRFKDDPRDWEEKIADEFMLYIMNNKLVEKSFISKIFDKIKRFLLKLKLRLKEAPEDIFDRIISGQHKPTADYISFLHLLDLQQTLEQKLRFSSAMSVADRYSEAIEKLSHRADLNYKNKAILESKKAFAGIKKFFMDFLHGIAPELNTPELIRAKEAIRKLAAIKSIAASKALDDLKTITKGMTAYDKNLMEKYLILKDIEHSLNNGIQTFNMVQKQWRGIFEKREDITNLLNELQKKVDENEIVKKALAKRRAIYKKLISRLKEFGYIDEEQFLDIDSYFHRITERVFDNRIRLHTTYQGQTPKIESLMDRVNSAEPYITEYIYSEYEALAQFHLLDYYHNVLQDLKVAAQPVYAELLKDLGAKGVDVTKKTLSQLLTTTHVFDDLREKYKDYVVKDIKDIPHFYTVYTLPNDTAKSILENGLPEDLINKLPDEIRQQVAVKVHRDEILMHKNTLKALTDIVKLENPPPLVRFMRASITAFKKYILFSPFRILKYSFNNLISDVDFAMALSPKITFKYAPQAAKDLYNFYYKDGKGLDERAIREIKRAEELLVLGTNITSEEVEHIARLEDFKDLMGVKTTPNDLYWSAVTKANNFRESILRLAAYRHYLNELKEVRAGRKRLEDVVSVVDIDIARELFDKASTEELAAKMAREGIGDYGDISPNGQWLRRNMIPFWSWTEINMRRYINLFRIYGKLLKRRQLKPYAPILMIARMGLLYSMVTAFNYFFFPEAAKQINNEEDGRLFIILGKDADGNYRTLNFNAALTDFLDWGGLANLPGIYQKLTTGQSTPVDVLTNIPKSAINKFINMAMPIQKTILEDLTGVSLFPDVFHPRALRDRTKHLLSLYGLSLPYDIFFSGKPAPKSEQGILGKIQSSIMRTMFGYQNLDLLNYYSAKEIVSNWAKTYDRPYTVTMPNAKSEYAYYYRLSLINGDKESAIQYLAKYYTLGGTIKSMMKSLKSMHPLSQIKTVDRIKFLKSLTPEELQIVNRAIMWYKNIILKHGKFSNKELLEIYKKAFKLSLKEKSRRL